MQCLAIRHLQFEDLGTFEEVLRDAGFGIHMLDVGVQSLGAVDWDAYALVVVLGGPVGVYEAADYPWLADEIQRIGQRLHKRLPTLGICLGAQLIAAALGARVYPGPVKEIGWSPLQLAGPSCLQALAGTEVLHWHGDTFDLPAGATLLASTPTTPNQAFAVGAHTLALQFHAEAHGNRIEPWLIGHTSELRAAGVDIGTLRRASLQNADSRAQAGQALLRQWLRENAGHFGTHR